MRQDRQCRAGRWVLPWILLGTLALVGPAGTVAAEDSRLSDQPMPMQPVPERPKPLIELGDPFLGMGPISQGITLPTGAVWRPQLIAFGTVRSSLQTFDPGDAANANRTSEWVNRIDLFGNLQLSPTERVVVGIRPVDEMGRFSGYRFKPDSSDGWIDGTNAEVRVAFMEGEFGEIFPRLDPEDQRRLDYGFAVGRQPLIYQDGLLVNDTIDTVGLVRKNVFLPGTIQGRWTALYSWGEVHRGNGMNVEDQNASLYGFVAEFDTVPSVVNMELFYLDSTDQSSGFGVGLSAQQQLGRFASSIHGVYSNYEGPDRPFAGDGSILFGELSITPHGTINNLYATAFWGHDRFRSIARAPGTGGPLGRAGILFAGVGIGSFGAALGNQADNSVGGTVGYQMFWQNQRRQLIVEAGGREELKGAESGAYALGMRFQQAIGQRWQLQATGFVGERVATGFMNGLGVEVLYRL